MLFDGIKITCELLYNVGLLKELDQPVIIQCHEIMHTLILQTKHFLHISASTA